MGIIIVEDGIMYDYMVSYDSQIIVSEKFYYSPNGVKSKVFSRSGDHISVTTTPSGKKLSKIKEQVGTNSTFVSVAAQFNHDVCLRFNKAISKILVLTGDMSEMISITINRMNSDPEFKTKLIEAMNVADFSISDIYGSVKEKHVMDMRNIIPEQIIGLMMATSSMNINEMTLNIAHEVNITGLSTVDRTFPYIAESNGTIRMMCIMGPIIDALKTGDFIAIDEFASFLDDSICRSDCSAKVEIRNVRNFSSIHMTRC